MGTAHYTCVLIKHAIYFFRVTTPWSAAEFHCILAEESRYTDTCTHGRFLPDACNTAEAQSFPLNRWLPRDQDF